MSIYTLPTTPPPTNITWSLLKDQEEEEVVSGHWLYLGSRRELLELCGEFMLSDARCVEMDVDTFSAHSGSCQLGRI